MNKTVGTTMKKVILRILILIGSLLLITISFVAWSLTPKLRNLKSEYGTSDVIRATETFVIEHPGRWPRSWSDIGMKDQSALTKINLNLNPSTAAKEEVLASIQPFNGKYYTFPHSRSMLENLYSDLKKGLSGNAEQASADTPVTIPADKHPVKWQPLPPTSKDGSR